LGKRRRDICLLTAQTLVTLSYSALQAKYIRLSVYTVDSPIIPFQRKRKRNHDVAILLILLAVLLGTFLFVTVAVNLLLRSIPIP